MTMQFVLFVLSSWFLAEQLVQRAIENDPDGPIWLIAALCRGIVGLSVVYVFLRVYVF